ncbi:zinc finger, CCHC-type containing protein, partial [Tanacetum coccineum]
LNIVNENIDSAFMSTSKVNDSILWHVRLSRIHFKRMQDMLKDGLIPSFDMDTEKFLELIRSDLCDLHATPLLGNKKYCVTFINYASWFCYVYLLHLKDEALDKFKVFKTKDELQQGSLIKRFRSDIGGEYMDTLYFQSVGIIHEMTASYTPQQNGISERKNRVLKEMVNFMLSYSGPNQRVWGYRAVIRLPDPKLKTLGKRGIKCIFGFVCFSEVLPLHLQPISAEEELHLKFFVIEPNESVSINSIIESRDVIFDENRFSSAPKPSLRIPNGTEDIGGSVVPEEDDPKTFDEAMKSHDVVFWKEAINDEMDSIMGNNTWVLADLPPGCKWIFKRKLKYHQMDVKTYFLNGESDEEVSDKCVYNKFDETGKDVIICLYVDDMLIFGTDQVQVDLTKEFLSSMFSMKDMGGG